MSEVKCSFCGKPETEIGIMIHGPAASICNGCVALCTEMILDRHFDMIRWIANTMNV